LASTLNLARHHVISGENQAKATRTLVDIYTPIDLEVHEGLDQKFYLLDFSRLFPPVEPDPRVPSSYLVNLFRPEFVRIHTKPLCR
jgi:hypothetical protein